MKVEGGRVKDEGCWMSCEGVGGGGGGWDKNYQKFVYRCNLILLVTKGLMQTFRTLRKVESTQNIS
jgi:hypothetical protein